MSLALQEFMQERFTSKPNNYRGGRITYDDDYYSDYVEDDEEITPQQLEDFRKLLDAIWRKIGITISFSRHFRERLNERRITIGEVKKIYAELYKKHGDYIRNINKQTRLEVESVVRDLSTDINIPIAVRFNRRGDLELQGITAMKKKNFLPKPGPKVTGNKTLDVRTK